MHYIISTFQLLVVPAKDLSPYGESRERFKLDHHPLHYRFSLTVVVHKASINNFTTMPFGKFYVTRVVPLSLDLFKAPHL